MNLNIENLFKSYSNVDVLKNISVELKDIHSLSIIGPSGGGKSTFLRLLGGLEKPDTGKIQINNHNFLFNENYLNQYRKSVGMVFQSYNLFPHLSALRNITLPLIEIHKKDKDEAESIAIDLLKKFKLFDHTHKTPKQLSGGQQQRVSIARALSIEPEFLLFDEPTSALDPELTYEVLDMIEELKDEKKDMVIVTHEMGFAKKVSDYIFFMHDGEIIEAGTNEEIFNHSQNEIVQNFLDKILKY